MRTVILGLSALALTAPVALPTAAMAHSQRYDRYEQRYERQQARHDRREARRYDRQRSYRCDKRGGTTGLIVGGAGGALLGREIDGGHDRTTGTVLGAAVGALLGRHVERNVINKRC